MDATYKTSKWGFPLFVINVVTNDRKGHPVAMWLVESEDTASIAEALSMWVPWGPWGPEHVGAAS
jgi:hypothetical protein